MKRVGRLIEKIAEPENLYAAYYKAQRGKSAYKQVLDYRKNLGAELSRLRQALLSGHVRVGQYTSFTIYEPKERKITAAAFEERVLHHALMNVCHPYFEGKLIDQSYACRKGKGTYAALEQAKKYNAQYGWFLKLDYRKFFDSIAHDCLKRLLGRLFKDKRLLDIFEQILDSYAHSPGRGLPIGNLTALPHFSKRV